MSLTPFDRFEYQRNAVAATTGKVLNVGANEDPARLHGTFGYRVVNCDLVAYDEVEQRANSVHVLFNAVVDRWPFDDDSAELVVLGDIVEHLVDDECAALLSEAHRCGEKLCITTPCDERDIDAITGGRKSSNPYQFHRKVVTREYLERQLADAGWAVDELLEVDYGFVPLGFMVAAHRAP